jgi:ferric-dicitrate binding protein FerR (iron transport regulator)
MKEREIDSELLYRFFEGLAADDENIYIRKWFDASSQNREHFFRERKLFDALTLLCDEPDEISYDSISPDGDVRTGRRTTFGIFMKVAAAAVVLLMSGMLYMQIRNANEDFGVQAINVPAGQYVNLILPDGTRIWLNARTKIEYPVLFNKKQRVVKLDGQAYFEVAHNEDVPFVVETSKGNVSVLGTKFDVMAYSDEDNFETTLMDGKVKVCPASSPDRPLILCPDTRAYLKDGKLEVGRIDDYDIYRWKEGLICFNNASFEEIMLDFEKIYGMKINIENARVGKYLYTGKFRFVDGIDYALRVLQKDIKFGYERTPDNHIINIK